MDAARALAARIPTQVKLVALTIVYYAAMCAVYGYGEEPGWPIIDSVYFATSVMSTVGYGDVYPAKDNEWTRFATVLFAFSGIVLFLPVVAWIVSLLFTP